MEEEKQKKPLRKIVSTIILVLLLLLMIAALGLYSLWKSYYEKSNYVEDDDFTIYYEIPEDDTELALTESALETEEIETEEIETEEIETEEIETEEIETEEIETEEIETEEIETEISTEELTTISVEMAENEKIENASYVYNILLIGSDRRNNSWYGNSDSMILVSVNSRSKKIYMTSFMRDLYAVIPGIGVKKLNAAHAHGAGPLLVRTIEDNYKIDINNWASVDFSAMETIIDSVGGIDIAIYQAEADHLNSLIGTRYAAGTVHMNGKQAVEYARIRKIGKYDYERTSRQRRVLEQILVKARTMNLSRLNQFANNILPLVTHNIPELELAQLLTKMPEWIGYQLVQDRIPYDGLYGHQGEMLVPDFQATIDRLKNTIYAVK